MHPTQMNNMAVGVTGIQGTVPGISHGQNVQHNIGLSGNPSGAHVHGVMTNEEERKVPYNKELLLTTKFSFWDK